MAERLPEPPEVQDLKELGPELVVLPAKTRIARIFFRDGSHPTNWNSFRYWGPTNSRFDHQVPDSSGNGCMQDRGILYGAAAGAGNPLTTCVAEVFQTARTVDTKGSKPWFAVFETVRDLTLLDLSGLWVTRAGGNAAIYSGERAPSRLWSRVFYDAFPEIDGIWYPSSIAVGQKALALYERAGDALPAAPGFHRSLADPAMMAPLVISADQLGYGLV